MVDVVPDTMVEAGVDFTEGMFPIELCLCYIIRDLLVGGLTVTVGVDTVVE